MNFMPTSDLNPLPGPHPTAETPLSELAAGGKQAVHQMPTTVRTAFVKLVEHFKSKGIDKPTLGDVLALDYWSLGTVRGIGGDFRNLVVDWLGGHNLKFLEVSTKLADNPLLEDLYLDLGQEMARSVRSGFRVLADYLARPPYSKVNPRVSDLVELRLSVVYNLVGDFTPKPVLEIEAYLSSGGRAFKDDQIGEIPLGELLGPIYSLPRVVERSLSLLSENTESPSGRSAPAVPAKGALLAWDMTLREVVALGFEHVTNVVGPGNAREFSTWLEAHGMSFDNPEMLGAPLSTIRAGRGLDPQGSKGSMEH